MRRRLRIVAPLALVAVTVAVAVALFGGDHGPQGQRITASFEAVNGLIPGAEVRAGGVLVGRVEKVTLGPGDVPQVHIRFNRDYSLHRGAHADIRLASQAGQLNRYIEVVRGDGPVLPDGGRLDLAQTDQPVELDDALSGLTPPVRADVQHLAAALDNTLRGHADDLSVVLRRSGSKLREINALVGDLADEGPVLRRLIADTNTVTGRLAQDPGDLQGMTDELAATLQTTARRQRELAATVDGLPSALRSGNTALAAVRGSLPDVRGLLRSAGPAAKAARASAPTLSRALISAPGGLDAAKQLADQVPGHLTTLRPVVRAATPVVKELPGVLKQFAPVLDQMRARAPDALGWLPLLGDATGDYDFNGHAAALMVVLAAAPNDLVAPDQNGPGKLAAPFDRVPGAIVGEPWRDWKDSLIGDKPGGGG